MYIHRVQKLGKERIRNVRPELSQWARKKLARNGSKSPSRMAVGSSVQVIPPPSLFFPDFRVLPGFLSLLTVNHFWRPLQLRTLASFRWEEFTGEALGCRFSLKKWSIWRPHG